MPTRKEDLPGTLQRSPRKAQKTYAETLDSAEAQYDSEERAHRTAWAAVKQGFEKVGDHWEAKDDTKIYQYNYEATKLSIARAMKGEPPVSEISTWNWSFALTWAICPGGRFV